MQGKSFTFSASAPYESMPQASALTGATAETAAMLLLYHTGGCPLASEIKQAEGRAGTAEEALVQYCSVLYLCKGSSRLEAHIPRQMRKVLPYS